MFLYNSMLYFNDKKFTLFLDDTFIKLQEIEEKSIDMIFADPPYFLSSGGVTCRSGKMVSVNKAEWDKTMAVEEKHNYNRKWIKLCKKVLSDNGSIWISGTMHNIYSIGLALEQEGFKILNNITWQKTNPPPNLACRCFVHSSETILWAKKNIKNSKPIFNYHIMKSLNNDKQDKDIWNSALTPKKEKTFGKHPTQKPIWLLEKIILSSTTEGDIVLDPFNGSGTTGIAAHLNNRKYIGIDNEEDYLKITKLRYEDVVNTQR